MTFQMVHELFSNNCGYKVSRVHYVSILQSHLFMRPQTRESAEAQSEPFLCVSTEDKKNELRTGPLNLLVSTPVTAHVNSRGWYDVLTAKKFLVQLWLDSKRN